LSTPGSVVQSLETLIRVRNEFPQIGLAACGGVSTSSDLIKALLAGADAAMVTSAIYRKGPAVIGCLLQGLTNFMNSRGVVTLEELKSLRPQVADLQRQVDIVGCELETAENEHAQPEFEAVSGDRFGHPK
jgi:dihydroorotate dehydrogenase (fumarate)